MLQRNMDTEAELSEALGILETLKSSSAEIDLRVANISSDLKVPMHRKKYSRYLHLEFFRTLYNRPQR